MQRSDVSESGSNSYLLAHGVVVVLAVATKWWWQQLLVNGNVLKIVAMKDILIEKD